MWANMRHLLSGNAQLVMRHELDRLGFLGSCLLLLAGAGLAYAEGGRYAVQWTCIALLLWALVWQQSAQRLQLNRADADSPLYPSLGPANRLTILRGYLIALTGGFFLQNSATAWLLWLPAFFYSIAAILDRVDGFVARRTGQTSLLGTALDNVFDALGLVVAPLLAVDLGKTHWSYLLVSVAYYAFHLGLRWRTRQQHAIYPMQPNKIRRTLAGFQMGYVAAVLWPPFHAEVTRLAGFAFMLPVLLGFAIDWCVVSGRLDFRKSQVTIFFQALTSWGQTSLPLLLRISFVGALAALLWGSDAASLVVVGYALAALSVALGIAARMGALLALLLLALLPIFDSSRLLFQALLFISTWILLLGSGRFSLWLGDDDWVERHDGAV